MRKAIARYAEHYGLLRRLDGGGALAPPRRHRAHVLRELLHRRAPDDTITASDLLDVHRLVGCGAHPTFHAGRGFDRARPGAEPALPPHPTQAFDQLAMRVPTTGSTVVVTLFRLVPHDSTYDIYRVQYDGKTVATTYEGSWTEDGDEGCAITVGDVLRVEMHGQRGLRVAMPAQGVDVQTTGGGPVVATEEPVAGNRGYVLGCAGFLLGASPGGVAGIRRWGTHGGTVGLSSWLHHRVYEGWAGHAAVPVPLDRATYAPHVSARYGLAAVILETAGKQLILHLATNSSSTAPPHSGKTTNLLLSEPDQDLLPPDSPQFGRLLLTGATAPGLALALAALTRSTLLTATLVGLIVGLILLLP